MAVNSSLRVAAELKELPTIRQFVERQAIALHVEPTAIYDLLLAVDELATNIIVHGYRKQPGTIDVVVRQAGERLEICLHDRAPPFDPTQIPAPDLTRPLSKRRLGGMGIYLARQLSDSLIYRRTPAGANELILVKDHIIQPTS
jgi:serine/threonine-protein kinase RsbW